MQSSKVAWLESQYLYPHHFQQQERYLEALVEARCNAVRPHIWGFFELEVDGAALMGGQVGLLGARGVMPDGTPFQLPTGGPLPTALVVPAGARDVIVYLVLASYQPGCRHLDANAAHSADRVVRYRMRTVEVFDYAAETAASEQVEAAVPNFGLALEGENIGGYTALPVARIREVSPEGGVVLDGSFMPPALTIHALPRLRSYLADVIGMVDQRAATLAARFIEPGGNSAIADFLLLQLLNRVEPRLRHLHLEQHTHPEELYRELLGLAGELATFTTDSKRPLALPPYRHNDLSACFQPLSDQLSRALSAVIEQSAIALPVEARQYGIHVARIADRSLIRQAVFVLAIRADVTSDVLRDEVPALMKVGTVESIRDLVNNQLPGIGYAALPAAPREIPFKPGAVYFELDSAGSLWDQLRASGGFALHIAGELPALQIELWAVRR